MSDERPPFRRPWEEPSDDVDVDATEDDSGSLGAEDSPEVAEAADGPESTSSDTKPPSAEPDLTDWAAMAALAPSDLDAYSSDTYVNATTEEYKGLAEEISRLQDKSFERQAVSATMAGVDTGLVGFEDVTGRRGMSEEDVEAAELARSSDLALRVGSALALIVLFMASLYMGGWWFTAFLALLMLVALGELYATLRKVGYAPLALVGLAGVVAMAVLTHTGGVFAFAGVTVVATVATVLVFSLAPRRHPLENASVTVFGMLWVGLMTFAVPIAGSLRPLAYILMVAVITAMVDMGSYFVGRGFGSRSLAPTLSPNKTVEGFFGGIAAAILTAAVISTLPPYAELGFVGSLALGFLISVVAPLGDLGESMVKRSLGVKDMGSVLPGHGGMLDRIDSFLFSIPAAYVFLLTLDLV